MPCKQIPCLRSSLNLIHSFYSFNGKDGQSSSLSALSNLREMNLFRIIFGQSSMSLDIYLFKLYLILLFAKQYKQEVQEVDDDFSVCVDYY